MKVRALDEHGYPIDHSAVRFRRVTVEPALPKPGDSLPLATASGKMLQSTVVRADWSEDKEMFVVECQYASRSIAPEDYDALVTDPEWRMTPLI